MKVTGINNVFFRGNDRPAPVQSAVSQPHKEIRELGYVTPDFNVKVPQKYTKTGEDSLPNGLKVHSYKLANGYKVSIVPMEGSPAVVKTYVNVGSLNETPDIKGISHFLEHMAFNGTNGENGHMKLETGDSFKKIDEIGGWANATTNYALTDYINKTPLLEEKDLETQIKVLAAMAEDLKLSEKMIEKEKGPVSSEINMILDNPQTIALDQTLRTLFNIKNPADELVGGSVNHIRSFTKKDVENYYNKYYTPANTNIVITGDVNPEQAIQLVSKNFVSQKKSNGQRFEEKLTPITSTVRKDFKSDKTKSTEIVLGFEGPKNNDYKESVLFRVASMYLNSEDVGLQRKLKDLNVSYGVGNERITTNPNGSSLVYLGMTSSEADSENALKTAINTINSAKPISQKELNRIKESLKENRELSFEYSADVNNIIGNAVLEGVLNDTLKFDEILDSITPQEVNQALKKYYNVNRTAITVVHPEQSKNISFTGTKRQPVNMDKISTTTLDNNVNVGFYKTNSPVRNVSIEFVTDVPYTGKPAVRDLMSYIYSMGTKDMDENSFNKMKEELNLDIYTYSGAGGITADIVGNKKNYKQGLKIAQELIYNPRITEENLQKAKNKLKESLKRNKINADNLYYNKFYSKYNPYSYSDNEILESVDSVTTEDLKDFHDYVLKNSRAVIVANISENDSEEKEEILSMAKGIHNVLPNVPKPHNIYKRLKNPVVLTSAQNNSQADIKQVYNFKYEDTIKNHVTAELMNSILSSSSIGLFDVLREKEHLAYEVYSTVSAGSGNSADIALNIRTTTDNKENGEKTYENLQRSIDGFKRQIGELLDGKFTEKDLENAKRTYKARLLNNEGAFSKVGTLSAGLNIKHGVGYANEAYNEVDNITKEDIVNFAKNAFSVNPVYSITATQDTLDANRDYLEKLKTTV